jgi:hypothetical protein
MQKTNVTIGLDNDLLEALRSYIEDEYAETGVKIPTGQMVRKIIVAHLRKEGYLTDKPKNRQGSEQKSDFSLFGEENGQRQGRN